jgi:hypothetical protein
VSLKPLLWVLATVARLASSQILFFGAELTKVYAKKHASLAESLAVASEATAAPLTEACRQRESIRLHA